MSRTFADLGVSRAVVRALAERDITEPFAIQDRVVEDVLAGRDVLAKSPTGSGKTLAFGVPLVDLVQAEDRRPAGLVLAPTRELASQIVDELQHAAHARALRIAAVYGGVGIVKQAKEAARAHIVVATPGRLEDLLQRGDLTLDHVRVLVLDEADRMLDMGFLPAVERIVRQTPGDRQTLFFSATLDGETGRVAKRFTRDAVQHEHVPPKAETERAIEHRFLRVEHEHRVGALVRELQAADVDRALVFVRTKRGADRLTKRLVQHDVDAVAMHGDKSQNQREKALARFERGEVLALVATDVAARGIDVDGVTHVINYQTPDDEKTYLHRIGRTGRAGAAGTAVTLVDWDEIPRWQLINKALTLGHPDPPETYSTSPHLYEALTIPQGTKGVLPRAERTRAGLDAEEVEDLGGRDSRRQRGRGTGGRGSGRTGGTGGGSGSGGTGGTGGEGEQRERRTRTPRQRRRTRGGVALSASGSAAAAEALAEAPAAVERAATEPAASEPATATSRPRRRRRRRPSGGGQQSHPTD
jgi:ATP-dependent RNA helicase DeaD/ATP-dependent RNA helicase RhlE